MRAVSIGLGLVALLYTAYILDYYYNPPIQPITVVHCYPNPTCMTSGYGTEYQYGSGWGR